ncbi:MAG TPA: PAS domain S-box protein [Methanoregula sp.]|nr:PAS domain S-box protein [Methanoregula sp.]
MYRVLYIDDEPLLLDIGKLFLEKTKKMEVTSAESASEALGILKKSSFDAIVSDYQMPEMDGLALLKEVRARYGDVPFILFTGKGREEVVIEAIANGVDFYLQKGGDPQAQFAELAHKIGTAIERKEAAVKLKNSEARLRQIVDLVPHMIFAKDRDGNYILANRAVAEGYNTTVGELEGKSQALFHGDTDELRQMLEDDREVMATGQTKFIPEEPYIDANGKRRFLQTTKVPFSTPDTNQPAVLGIAIDITERKQTENELRAMNEQLAAAQEELRAQYDALADAQTEVLRRQQQIEGIAATVPGVVYQVREAPGGRIQVTYFNERAGENIFGLDHPDEDLFRWFVTHVHTQDRDRFIESIAGATKNGTAWDFEGRFVKPSGETIWFQGIGSPVVRGPAWIYSGVLLDVTGRKRQEHILKAQLALGLRLQEIHGLKETLDACLSAAIEVSGMDAGGIYLVDDRTGSVDLAVSRNLGDDFVRTVSHYPAGSINAQAVYAGNPFYGRVRGSGLVDDDVQEREGILAFGIVPIASGGRATACLNVTSHTAEEIPADTRIALETIATQIGSGIGRIRSEEAVQERENKYRALVETTRTGYVIIDACGRVLDANQEYIRLTGHAALEEIAGRSVIEWTAEYEKEKNAGAVQQCIRDGFIRNLEIDYSDASGRITPVELNATVIRSGESAQILTLCRDISERRRIQSALRESEEKYRTLVEHTQDGVFIVQDSRLAFYNQAFAETLGFSGDELIGHHIAEVIAPEDQELVISRHRERVAGRRLPEAYEFSLLHKDKKTRLRMRMLVGLGVYRGRPATIGTLHDVTEDRQREEELRESEERHRLLADNATDVIWTMDLSGRFTYVSPSVRKLRGYTAEEALQQPLDRVFAPASAAVIARELAAAAGEVRAGRRFSGYRGELEQLVKDGSTTGTEVTMTGIYNAADEFVGILGVSRDITERRRLEQALQESESKFRSIFNNTSDAIQIVAITPEGLPGKYIEINDVGCRMLQYSRGELLAKSPIDIATEYGQLERARRDMDTLGHTTFETTYRRKDGSELPVEVNTQVATIGGRTVAVSVVRDTTERKKAEDALRRAYHKLNLLSSVTRHDVLNQLLALKGYVALSKGCSAAEKLREFHGKEEAIVERIERQILFTKEYQDIGNQVPGWQNVEASLKKAVQGLDLSGTELKTAHLDSLEILADPLLQKVFFNLIENALRHGGETLTEIRIFSRKSGGSLVIVYEDNGSGIPAREKELIFERGYGRNTGFGLFLIREILAITGITVTETGVPGKGARFEILVPEGAYRSAGET